MTAAPIVAVLSHPRHALAALFVLGLASACSSDARETPRRTAAKAGTVQAPQGGEVAVVPLAPTSYTTAAVASPGTVTGAVRLSSPVTPLPPVPTGTESSLCGPGIPDESVREKGGALEGAVVWLDGARKGKALPLERRIELESDHCKLVPRVQAAVVGSAANIVGHDDLRQHLTFAAMGDPKVRATILLGRGEQVIPTALPFSAPGLVSVRDADRAWPRAFIAVFDHPYFAVTSPAGTFTIDGVPPGTYTLHVWHERTKPFAQQVQVTGNGSVRSDVTLAPK